MVGSTRGLLALLGYSGSWLSSAAGLRSRLARVCSVCRWLAALATGSARTWLARSLVSGSTSTAWLAGYCMGLLRRLARFCIIGSARHIWLALAYWVCFRAVARFARLGLLVAWLAATRLWVYLWPLARCAMLGLLAALARSSPWVCSGRLARCLVWVCCLRRGSLGSVGLLSFAGSLSCYGSAGYTLARFIATGSTQPRWLARYIGSAVRGLGSLLSWWVCWSGLDRWWLATPRWVCFR